MACTIIAFTNQAGGVAKSTSVVNTAAFLAERYRVCVVDADGQQTATMNLGVNPYALEVSLYDALLEPKKYRFSDVVQKTPYGPDLLPASEDLYAADLDLIGEIGRESRMRDLLNQARPLYDFILLDLPPSLGLMQVNGLTAADYIVIVCQAHPKSFNGLNMLLETIDQVRDALNPPLELLGVLITILEQKTKVAQMTLLELEQHPHLGGKLLQSRIHKNVTLAEAAHREELVTEKGIAVLGEPIRSFDAKGTTNGYQDYQKLAAEIESIVLGE